MPRGCLPSLHTHKQGFERSIDTIDSYDARALRQTATARRGELDQQSRDSFRKAKATERDQDTSETEGDNYVRSTPFVGGFPYADHANPTTLFVV